MVNTRSTDPITSHEAADSVKDISDTQKKILSLLETPMTDEELITAFRAQGWYGSDSGIRSRRKDLVDFGVVTASDYSVTRSGRRTIVWKKL